MCPPERNGLTKTASSIQGSSQSGMIRQRTPTTATRALKNGCRRNERSATRSGYQSGDQTYQYSDLSGNNLHYQLVVQTAAEDDADIVITDTLPENTEFNENWVTIGMDEGAPDKVNALKGAAATVAYEKTTRQLTITIRDYNLEQEQTTQVPHSVQGERGRRSPLAEPLGGPGDLHQHGHSGAS